MKFSQRIGKAPATKTIQLESLDDDLKNSLWNIFNELILGKLFTYDSYMGVDEEKFRIFCKALWHNYFKLTIDTIPYDAARAILFIKDKFYKGEWYEQYDMIEYIANIPPKSIKLRIDEFKSACNLVLENEFSAYRFIGNQISPITNKNEIQEIEYAIDQSESFSSLVGVNIHLKSALDKLSDKKAPDYRNSIKESISAIESIAKIISGNDKDTLGGALDKIKGKIKLHPALVTGFRQLYGYTSDNGGIRHALMDEENCDFEDAKYMLVSCSAFINFLISKANKAGITLNASN